MLHESPLQSVHSLGRDEGSLSLHELTVLCTNLSNKVTSLEAELAQTKQTYGTALTKLIKKVKKLEQTMKISQSRRRTRVVLSDEEEVFEDPSKHGRKIQEKISDDTEVLLEEEETSELIEEPTELVEDQGSGEKGEQEVSTATANLVYIRRSAEKRKDKGKAIMIEDESIQKKSKKQLEQERKKEAVTEVDTAHVIDWNDPSVIRYHALQHRPRSVAEVRKNMIMYLKNQGGYKMKDFKGMSYDDIRPIFEKVWDQVHSFVPMDSEEEVQRLKRAVPDEGINVEALQTKYPIIGWEVYSEDTMQFWKIIRVGNHTEEKPFAEGHSKFLGISHLDIHEEVLFTDPRDDVASIKRRRRDLSSDGVRDLATAS
ncbi:hypothetical protein Tco_0444685 [Tanacetum coccineum]